MGKKYLKSARVPQRSPRPLHCFGRSGTLVFKVGERVMEQARSTERPARVGMVREVVREDPPRDRIRWDDGHGRYSASAGALNPLPAKHEAAWGRGSGGTNTTRDLAGRE